jgi:DNA-binding transcriptional regulator LsrR (DeoR family)
MASIGRREKVRNANRDQLRVVKSTERPPRRKKHRGISKNAALIERVMLVKFPPRAALPYRSDREVAREVGISVQAVGELVKAGFERGLVSPLYNIPLERREVARLENAVRTRYQLQQVLLVPGLPDMLAPRDVQERRNVHTHVLHSIAPRVVEHLDALLAPGSRRHERFTLGVAWGRTMRMIAEHLHSTPRDFRFPELQVLPIVGITCEALAEPTEANVIAMRFAEAYDGESVQLAHPAFVHRSDLWIGHQRLEQVHRVLQLLPSCQAVLTSMGPIPPH